MTGRLNFFPAMGLIPATGCRKKCYLEKIFGWVFQDLNPLVRNPWLQVLWIL